MNKDTPTVCTQLHSLVDLYLDNALSPDEAVAFAHHLTTCGDLAALVAKRTDLRIRLREAVRNTSLPTGLREKVRLQLTAAKRESPQSWALLAIAATVLLGFWLAMSWRTGSLRFTPSSQESYIASITPAVSPVMRIGLEQHIHCAVFHKLPSQWPSLEQVARGLGPEFTTLIPAVQGHLPPHYRVVQAHLCDYHGRVYTHLRATDGTGLMSLLITNRAQGEAFERDLRAIATGAGDNVYASSVQRFSLAGFETRDHLVYLVSDMGSKENLETLQSMVPEVSQTIRTREI